MRSLLRGILLLALTATPSWAETLRVASADWPPGLGNPFASIAQASSHTRAAIFDPLTRFTPEGKLEPALALSWEPIDTTTWRFHLRPNVQFSNGEPFNALAVKAVFDYLRSPAGAHELIAEEARDIREIRIVDELAVDIRTQRSDAILPKRLSLIMMVPPKAWAAETPEEFGRHPIGTGSYLMKDWGQKTGRTIIVANPTSWRKPIKFDRIELTPLKDPTTRIQALLSGQVDVTQGLSHEDLGDLQEQGYRVAVEADAQVLALALRNVGNDGSPLQDVRVRQALNYAINKDAIVQGILNDTVQAVGQGAIAGVVGYNPDVAPYPYDPAKAKALLAEAGYPNGLKLKARVQVQAVVSAADVFSAVASDLRAVGVDLEMRQIFGQEWVRMYMSGDWDGADIISVSWNAAAFNDVARAIETFSCNKTGSFFCAPEITPLAEASDAQLDPEKRDKQLQQIMALYHDLAPSIYLVNLATIMASSPRIGPLVFTRTGLMFDKMTTAKP